MSKKSTKTGIQRSQLENRLSKHEKSTHLVDVVRKYSTLELSNDELLDVIEFETGKKLTLQALVPIIDDVKREIQEAEIQVNIHMDYMIRIGLFESTIRQDKSLELIERIILNMIIKERARPEDERNNNLILNAAEKYTKVTAARSNVITNFGYLSKARKILEAQENDKEGKTTVLVENPTEKFEKENKILEIEDNKVF